MEHKLSATVRLRGQAIVTHLNESVVAFFLRLGEQSSDESSKDLRSDDVVGNPEAHLLRVNLLGQESELVTVDFGEVQTVLVRVDETFVLRTKLSALVTCCNSEMKAQKLTVI